MKELKPKYKVVKKGTGEYQAQKYWGFGIWYDLSGIDATSYDIDKVRGFIKYHKKVVETPIEVERH